MGRKEQVTLPYHAWCSKGKHELPVGRFYTRSDGRPRTWCIDCTKVYAQERGQIKDLKKKPEFLEAVRKLKEVAETPWEEEVEEEVKEEHKKGPTAPSYWDLKLDWLTPVYAFERRPISDASVELDRLTPEG